jgi:hypothetical protein
MGVMFKAQNRERAKSLGGQELDLSELKAIRLVRGNRKDPASAQDLAELDFHIHQLTGPQLIEDLAVLRSLNDTSLAKLAANPRARLSREGAMFLGAWLSKLGEFQRGFPEILDIAHLLQPVEGACPVILELNRAYLALCVLSNEERYWTDGFLGGVRVLPQPKLREELEQLATTRPLADFLDWGNWFDDPHPLTGLPEDPIARARTLMLYSDYLVLATISSGFNDFGGMTIEAPEGPIRLNRAVMWLDSDPGAFIQGSLDSIGALLDRHLKELAESGEAMGAP